MGDSQPQAFSVRIVSIDYYMAPPIPDLDISYSPFHGGKVNEVPVIRIYGSTPAGQKTCLHVHRVLPYLYVPCSDLGPITNAEAVNSRNHSLTLALEKALKLKGNAGSKRQHVHGCDVVRARKFYGYHSSEELFVKIYFSVPELSSTEPRCLWELDISKISDLTSSSSILLLHYDEPTGSNRVVQPSKRPGYYPHDVSRAADILLTGAILDKTLQPYESHIPFLLQFLIDYNLYGMGLLHASKVRFRYPVPDDFSQRKVMHQGKVGPMAEDSTCMSSQADVGDDLCLNSPIWISSTIPDGWIWQYSPEPDSSNRDIPLFRRQSTSELEVDAAVHDIINQQLISYASLSQTHAEVKMVQSLVPIWEEEYERNGVPEAMPLDSEKPLPQDVLRILSDGIEFENLLEVSNEAENGPVLTPESINSSKVYGNLVDSYMANINNSNDLPFKYLKASDRIGSLLSSDSPFQNVDAVRTNDIDSADHLQISGIGPSIAKATDEDALRLLKWLASSQAAEDINSDDELAPEMILSPLPLKDIDKVLEIANVDYESESQKECQDILDTIDMLNFEESNDNRALLPAETSHSRKCSSNRTIPQVDGSSDDLQSTPCQNMWLKTDKSAATSKVEGQSWPQLDSNLLSNNRTKRPRWGSLPVSRQKASDVLPQDTLCILNGDDDERSEGLGTSCLGDESKRVPIVKVDEQKNVGGMRPASVIVECSTRDLMRRKRSHRIELSECMSQAEEQKVESCPDADGCKGDIGSDSKLGYDSESPKDLLSPMHTPSIENPETKFLGRNINSIVEVCSESVHVKQTCTCFATIGELPLSSSKESLETENLPKNGDSCCDCVKYDSSLHVNSCKLEHASVLKNIIVGEDSCSRMLQTGKLSNMKFENERYPGLSEPHGTLDNVNKESVKLIGMTPSVKPPTIDWTDEPKREASAIQRFNVETSLLGNIADKCLPFFVRNPPEGENQGVSFKQGKCIGNNEPVMGIPTLYQNDGSYLFILTPAVSPPLRESVDGWLSSDPSDILRQKMSIPSPLLPISAELPGDMVDSQSYQTDDSNFPLTEPASLSGEKNPNINHVSEHIQKNCSSEVKTVLETKKKTLTACSGDTSQLSGPDKNTRSTPLSQIGFRDPASAGQGQQLTLMSIEVHAESRGDLRPDPQYDSINIIVLVLQEDDKSSLDTYVLLRCGSVYAEKNLDAVPESRVFAFTEELQLLKHFTKIVRTSDPDVLMGWDVQSGSIGFLAERAAHLGVGLLNNISRTPSQIDVAPGDSKASEKERGKVFSESVNIEAVQLENAVIEDEWGRTHASGVHVGGRIVLNIWRLMRNEIKLNMYTVEAVAEAVLRRKIPHITWKVLTKWFSSGPGLARYRSIDYTLERAKLGLQIMSQLDMINRTSELARVFGIDFFSVLSRGSQYRVESMFLRLAHTQNYLAISPGKQQVANQPAMECLPLVMEPESNFYADPVIVLDFQSLYPSMVIAYNLCFCTCLGKITPSKANTLGVSFYSPDVNDLCNLKREFLMTPNGVVYVPSKVRKGILPRLLEEILSTRIMVKQAMKKLAPSQLVLRRILNARQLALKLIANVTYGYTAAGFSGRMPCAELADSIVQCGRRTLEAAISFVNSNDNWKARVIYGDTDSMFVLLKGRSVKEAFAVGREIASAITEMNPSPITLKMEKVYFPCFLLTKKRYVGYSYERPDQSKPIFDAKGIETVRRDTCAAVSKMMEQSLRTYFESRDIHMVKEYVLRQWTRILSGRFSLQDFVFAKEVRLGTYTAGAYSLPPAAIVATKSLRTDPRAEPRYAERIPYVVVHGEPGARLVDMVVDPLELLAINSPFRLNDIYYIRKQIIPALQRVFGLVGADLNQWFLDMPRPAREFIGKKNSFVQNPRRMRIDYYYASRHCILCGDLVQGSAHLCHNCSKDEVTVATALTGRTSKLEKDMQHLAAICRHCGGGDWLIESGVKCSSLACSVFYERIKVQKELLSLSEAATRTGFYPKCMVEWF